jgi:ERCC4-type nuclease
VSSIMGGRYEEQRQRLKRSGVTRVVYVVEGEHSAYNKQALPASTIESAMSSLQVCNFTFAAHNHSNVCR